jgi:hypothetical protein
VPCSVFITMLQECSSVVSYWLVSKMIACGQKIICRCVWIWNLDLSSHLLMWCPYYRTLPWWKVLFRASLSVLCGTAWFLEVYIFPWCFQSIRCSQLQVTYEGAKSQSIMYKGLSTIPCVFKGMRIWKALFYLIVCSSLHLFTPLCPLFSIVVAPSNMSP